jgi:hypothetical protein
VLGFWPQLLLVVIALYFAGTVFATSVLGRWLLFIPVLMTFAPFVWHIQQIRQFLITNGLEPSLVQSFTALAVGLGLILFVVSTVWAWRYTFSLFLFPLLAMLVYSFGPLLYLNTKVPALIFQTNDLSLFAALASLGLLAYTLPYVRAWLATNNENSDSSDPEEF